ncbi:odorant receptor 13a-like [Fopius arisanus]|uniref:Odorant receptor n=1 Tax=Fopius arisanus TaxID=64838 RepID=A0A9R1U511_9HYME|nr:PREDICTED: odorant receptor 13a-like [Fopius arisanus]
MGKDLLKSYTSYAKNVKRISIISGIWPSEKPNIFYKSLPYFIISVLLTISCATMNFAYVNIHNMNRVMKGMSISLSYLNAIMKVICYLVHREKLIELNDTINELLRRQQGDEQLLSRTLSSLRFFKVLSMLLMWSASIVVGMYFITPLMIMINQYSHGVKPIRYLLPYPAVYPYKILGGSALYALHYAIESYGCLCLFSTTASIDNIFALYSSQIIGQLRALTYEMKRFTFKVGYEKHLQGLIEVHRKLIRCCQLLQAIHGPIVLTMMVITAIILCCLIFQISQMKTVSVKQVMFFVVYISVKLLQTLIYAWAGTLITTECDNFRNEVYATGWENLGLKSAGHHVKIILMQRPIRLKACSYTFISMNLFTGILNTTLSYFFLLQALDDEQ